MKRLAALAFGTLLLAQPALAQVDENEGQEEGLIQLPDRPPVVNRPWSIDWFAEPVSYARGYSCTVCWSKFGLELVSGVEGGVQYRQKAEPNLYGFTRGKIELPVGLLDGVIGVDIRLGSFFGQDHRYYRVYTGPDFFGNAYPIPELFSSGNYALPWTEGVAWHSQGYLKVVAEFWLGLAVTPSWVFREKRRQTDLTPWHELSVEATMSYLGPTPVTAGYRWTINDAGTFHSIILAIRL